jgi:hypothetical protein
MASAASCALVEGVRDHLEEGGAEQRADGE